MLPEQFAPIFDALAEGVLIFDGAGRIVWMNVAARRRFASMTPAGYVDMSLEERVRLGVLRDVAGEPLSLESSPPYRVLHGEVLTDANSPDVMFMTHEGQDVALNFTGAPMRDGEGNITGAVLLARDVTDRYHLERRTQEALDALLAMAEALVQTTGEAVTDSGAVAQRLALLTRGVLGCQRVGISVVEPGTDLIVPFAVAGLSAEQEAFWWEDQRATAVRLEDMPDRVFVGAMRAGEIVHFDPTQLPDEQPNPYGIRDLLIVPMLISDHFMGWLALDHGSVAHQYTPGERRLAVAVGKLLALVIEHERLWQEREAARAEALALAAANRRMDEFLGIASHELRTPLTTIKANVQLTERALKAYLQTLSDLDPRLARLFELFTRTDQHINRLDRLVDDLLDVSRIQAGRLSLHIAPCDLAQIVREAVEEQRLIASSRDITLELDDGAVPVMIEADAIRIGQVVTNFLTNALKYSPSEAPVHVRLHVFQGLARVAVTDHGPGLPRAQQPRVWERFYRAPGMAVQHGSGVGLGLGLFICKTIIDRHGGSVGIHSAPSQGTTFWFQVPLAGAAPGNQSVSAPERRPRARSRRAAGVARPPHRP